MCTPRGHYCEFVDELCSPSSCSFASFFVKMEREGIPPEDQAILIRAYHSMTDKSPCTEARASQKGTSVNASKLSIAK